MQKNEEYCALSAQLVPPSPSPKQPVDEEEPSLYLEWNQAEGDSIWVGGNELWKHTRIPKYTPEMLMQRENLNWMFNFVWNPPQHFPSKTGPWNDNMVVPDITENLKLMVVGDNYGVAKFHLGGVFIPKGSVKYLLSKGLKVGSTFYGEITFTPNTKYQWRLKHNGVI